MTRSRGITRADSELWGASLHRVVWSIVALTIDLILTMRRNYSEKVGTLESQTSF